MVNKKPFAKRPSIHQLSHRVTIARVRMTMREALRDIPGDVRRHIIDQVVEKLLESARCPVPTLAKLEGWNCETTQGEKE